MFSNDHQVAHVIREIRHFQSTNYKIEHSTKVNSYLLDANNLVDDEELYQMSLEIEPRQSRLGSISHQVGSSLLSTLSSTTIVNTIGGTISGSENKTSPTQWSIIKYYYYYNVTHIILLLKFYHPGFPVGYISMLFSSFVITLISFVTFFTCTSITHFYDIYFFLTSCAFPIITTNKSYREDIYFENVIIAVFLVAISSVHKCLPAIWSKMLFLKIFC